MAELARITLAEALFSLPGGIGAALEASLIFGRQFGGPVRPGEQAIVGERGPEILTVGQPSRVDPIVAQAAAPIVNLIQVSNPEEAFAVAATSSSGVSTLVNVIAGNSEEFNTALGNA